MWKRGKATVDGDMQSVNIDYDPVWQPEDDSHLPMVLEWPKALALNTKIEVAATKVEVPARTYFAGPPVAIGGKWHVPLMAAPLLPAPEIVTDEPEAEGSGAETPVVAAPVRGRKVK